MIYNKPMDATTVIHAAKLIEQLEKLDAFLTDSPSDADTLTITFRKGKHSKSLSLNDKNTIVDLRKTVIDIRDQTEKSIKDLGVTL